MILTHDGIPARPELEAQLKAYDPRLGLRWCFGYWAVTVRWPEKDTRWQMVQGGRMPEEQAFDMMAQLPADCPPDQALGYLERTERQWRIEGREDITRIIEDARTHNQRRAAQILAPTLEYAEELVDANQDTLFDGDPRLESKNRTRVFQSESLAKPEKGRKRAKHTGSHET